MPREFLNPVSLPNWSQSFSQVVVVSSDASRTLYIAGQVSVDSEKKLVGEGDLAVQSAQAFSNLKAALAAGGATTSDVVKLGIYVKGYRPEHAEVIGAALRDCFPGERLPASTWLGVETLALDGLLIEVDAVAVVE